MDPAMAADEGAYHSYVLYFQHIFPNVMNFVHDFVSACTRLLDGQGADEAAPPDGVVHDEGDRVESTCPVKVHGAS